MTGDGFHQRLKHHLHEMDHRHLRRTRRTIIPVSSTHCQLNDRRLVNFATNDYLGLSWDPRVRAAFAAEAGRRAGSGSSPLIAGRTDVHELLERELAGFEHCESAVLFPSGYAANLGMLTSLITARDAVFCDRDNHASLIDGCRAAAGQMFVCRVREVERLRNAIQRRRAQYDQLFIVTDSVFSMDGTVAPLEELSHIAEQTDAVLVVDEAHGTGVFGATGRGVSEVLRQTECSVIRIGTLSKACGLAGGFVAGSDALCDWLWNTARSQFFSTALPPAVCAAARVSLQLIDGEPERRQRLHARCHYARHELRRLQLPTVQQSEGPIIPVLCGADLRAVRVSRLLQDAGFLIPAIRPPTVRAGTARLRLSLTCDHAEEQITRALEAIADALCREAAATSPVPTDPDADNRELADAVDDRHDPAILPEHSE